jgi:hypothetical protein
MTTLLTFQGQLNTVTTESQGSKTFRLFQKGGPVKKKNPSISQVGVHWVGPNNLFGRFEGEGNRCHCQVSNQDFLVDQQMAYSFYPPHYPDPV